MIAEGVGQSDANVQVGGEAHAGTDGVPILESISGRSTGAGTVIVRGTAYGASGTSAPDLDIANAVDGETSGALLLFQTVAGGNGSERVGGASSRLEHSGSSRSISVDSYAGAGNSVGVAPDGVAPADLADGVSEASATNAAGSATANSTGSGGVSFGVGGGGDGLANATANTSGDGHTARAVTTAYGGAAGSSNGPGLGRGGDARGASVATAAGHSDATSLTFSYGGDGAAVSPGESVTGAAFAQASSTSFGGGDAAAHAYAAGGTGWVHANGSGSQFEFGLAHAQATATGPGHAFAIATVVGSGSSLAESSAVSSGAITRADVVVSSDPGLMRGGRSAIAAFRDPLERSLVNSPIVQAQGSLAVVNALPRGTASWLAGNTTVASAVSATRNVIAIGFVRGVPGADHWTSTTTLDIDRSALPFAEDLALGFLDPVVLVPGLDVLEIHVSIDGHSVADFAFTDSASAAAGLDDRLLEIAPSLLGSGPISTFVVSVSFDASAPSTAFFSDFALLAGAPLPEPAGALLACLGASIALLRRGARSSVAGPDRAASPRSP